jgi:hypothetical protein
LNSIAVVVGLDGLGLLEDGVEVFETDVDMVVCEWLVAFYAFKSGSRRLTVEALASSWVVKAAVLKVKWPTVPVDPVAMSLVVVLAVGGHEAPPVKARAATQMLVELQSEWKNAWPCDRRARIRTGAELCTIRDYGSLLSGITCLYSTISHAIAKVDVLTDAYSIRGRAS